MTDKDIEIRAQVAWHDLLSAGNKAGAEAVDNLLNAWSNDRYRLAITRDHLKAVERGMDDAGKELKKVASLLGLTEGTDILMSLYPAVQRLVDKLDEAVCGADQATQRPSQGSLDTAFEAMARRLEEVLDENEELVRIIEKQSINCITTSRGAARS